MIPEFRAWDKNNQYMEYTDKNLVVCFSKEGSGAVDHTTFGHSCTCMEDIELMQSTGLKDKNGAEIFESDIVHIKSSDGVDYKVVIIFKDGGFCAVDGVEGNYSTRRYQLHKGDFELEVIGNIYETPLLLEVE